METLRIYAAMPYNEIDKYFKRAEQHLGLFSSRDRKWNEKEENKNQSDFRKFQSHEVLFSTSGRAEEQPDYLWKEGKTISGKIA